MPDAVTSAYLAKHYLDGARAEAMLARSGQASSSDGLKRKKKRRAEGESSASGSGFRVVEDADDSWKRSGIDDEDEEDGAVTVVNEDEAVKAKRKRWNKVGATAEDAKGSQAGDEVDAATTPSAPESSFKAGLKSKEEMRAERLERERLARESLGNDDEARRRRTEEEEQEKQRAREEAQQQTIYRDAAGRRIDVRAEEEEQRRRQQDEKRRDRERQDWNKGEAQLRQAREARQKEAEVRVDGVTRYASDARMNEELRTRSRAVADPAADFLSKRAAAQQPQMPSYKGSFPPNRFGIRPGYRWDGVERGNGFEAKLFQRRNQQSIKRAQERAWRQEDM